MANIMIHGYRAQCYDCFYYSISREMCDLKKEKRKAWEQVCKQFREDEYDDL